jgi:hypothetical protein
LIAQIASKVALLNEGKLIKCCPKQEFFENISILKKFDLEIPLTIELISELKDKKIVITEDFFDLEELIVSMPKDIIGNG